MKTARTLKKILLENLRPVPKVSVSCWADAYRMLPSDSAEPGKWKTSRVPYMQPVMDAFTEPNIKRIVVKSAAQVGKAISIDTPIATVDGFKLMRDIEVGDKVFDENGEVCNVLGVSPIRYDRDCYEITFSDGAKIVADAEHNWMADGKLLTTTQLRIGMKLPEVKPLKLPEKNLPRLKPRSDKRLIFNMNKPRKKFPPLLNEYLFGSQEQRQEALGICIDLAVEGWQVEYLFASTMNLTREVSKVEKVASVPVKCIAVDSPNHLFLAGRELIVTKNSEVLLNIVGRYVMLDPCTILIVQPTLETAMDFSKARLSKMIQDTKVLTPLFGEYKTRDANQTILSKFFKGGRVVLIGANSPAGLASKPIKILLCDEVDRYPHSANGNEGDPVELAARRTSTYWDSRIALFSTPTAEGASRIDVEYLLGTQEQWTHRCPNCLEFSPLDYRQMQVDYQQRKDEEGNKVIVVEDVKWRCPQCGFEFDELTMKSSAQKYVAQNPDALKNGIRSFYVNGFSSPWLEWKNIMREWLEARGDANREAVVYNTRFGLSYKQAGYYDDENIFLERREDYPAELPDGVSLLTAAVDVQANRLEYEIVGWRDGFERFGILRGLVRGEPTQPATWRELDSVLDRTFHFSNGIGMTVARTFIDSGYSTTAVYAYCRANMAKGRFPIKGKSGMGLSLLHKYSHPQNSNVILTILGVDDGKQEVMNNLGITEVGAGFMHFPRDDEFLGKRGYDVNYFKELISEHKVIKKSAGIVYETFEKINDKERNESLDLACYSLAAAKSCIGNVEPQTFWQSRRELLRDDLPTVKQNKPTKKSVRWKEVDIW